MKLKTLKEIELLSATQRYVIKQEAIKWVRKEGMIITADEWNEFFNITEEDLKKGAEDE